MKLTITMQSFKTNEIVQFSNFDLIARVKFFSDGEYSIIGMKEVI